MGHTPFHYWVTDLRLQTPLRTTPIGQYPVTLPLTNFYLLLGWVQYLDPEPGEVAKHQGSINNDQRAASWEKEHITFHKAHGCLLLTTKKEQKKKDEQTHVSGCLMVFLFYVLLLVEDATWHGSYIQWNTCHWWSLRILRKVLEIMVSGRPLDSGIFLV